jgi:cell division protein FtsI (penicillin-binding protein 3)
MMAIVLVTVLAFAVIGVRLFDLQARDRSHLVSLGVGQRMRTVAISAERGKILDRTGKNLAVSVAQTTIVANPSVIKDPVAYAAKLAPVVHVDQARLESALSDHTKQFAYVARKVDDATAKQVRKLDLVGVSYQDESKRFNPNGNLAGPVLGFVGLDNQGLGGLEWGYNSLLTGKAGEVQVERDPQGNDIPGGEHMVTAAKRGDDLVLTLDASLQWQTEKALKDGVSSMNAARGTAIVVDVRTGDVLAMATVDGAKADGTPVESAPSSENNSAVTDVYEPGSTNKVITMAGAIQEGLIAPGTVFNDVGQSVDIGGYTFEDAEEHPTTMTATDILAMSSNVGTIGIARQLGPTKLSRYLDAFGFGQPTGLGLPGESAGTSFEMPRDYTDASIGSVPIGYSISVTPMQMLDVYTTIANHGIARAPRLVAATIDADGKRHDKALAKPRQVVSAGAADAVNTMLQQVVATGTGTKAQIPGYPVAGKTGTAAKAPYNTGEYNASFAGFAPANDPHLAAIVVMDSPQGSIFGADAAAPVFQQIMRFALTYERVPTS